MNKCKQILRNTFRISDLIYLIHCSLSIVKRAKPLLFSRYGRNLANYNRTEAQCLYSEKILNTSLTNGKTFVKQCICLRDTGSFTLVSRDCGVMGRTEQSLHNALTYKLTNKVRRLLDRGVNVNLKFKDGDSPLHVAVDNHVKEMVEILLEKGAEINTPDGNGDRPLHRAFLNVPSEDIVKVLIERGSDIDTVNNSGYTPLDYAVRSNFEIGVDLLLERGANADHRNGRAETPLHHARTASIVNKLLTSGAQLEAKNKFGETPLHCAVFRADATVVKALLDAGADVNARCSKGRTPLHNRRCGFIIGQMLIDKGADVNVRDNEGMTPLHRLIFYNGIKQLGRESGSIINQLVYSGTLLDIVDYYGYSLFNISSGKTLSILKEHVVKVQAANLDFNLKKKVHLSEFEEYRRRCEEELGRLRQIKCGTISLYRVLQLDKCRDPVVSDILAQGVGSSSLETDFPIYAQLLRLKFANAKKRHTLLNVAMDYFSLPFPIEVRRMILCHLDNKSLEYFVSNNSKTTEHR